MDIYREIILDHYRNPRNFGKIPNPTVSYNLYNAACGDKINLDVKLKSKNGRKFIEEIKFEAEGCALSIASTSILSEKVTGETVEEIKKIKKDDVLAYLGATLTPTRLKCALLPLEALHSAIKSCGL